MAWVVVSVLSRVSGRGSGLAGISSRVSDVG